MRSTTGTGAVLVAAATVLSGCGLIPGGGQGQQVQPSGGDRPTAAPASPVPAGRGLQRVGYCSGGFRSDARFRLRVLGVERYDTHTSLRLQLAYLGPDDSAGDTHMMGEWGSFSGFALVDTISKKIFRPIHTYTVDAAQLWWQRGVTYETDVQFDALPLTSNRVAVLTPCATGAIPGVPVTSGPIGHTPANPVTPSDGEPEPGSTVVYDADVPDPDEGPNQHDITTTKSSTASETATGNGEEKVALHSDVLFAVDKATLTPAAKRVLDETAAEVKDRAEPSRPVQVVGHTDSTGGDAHNLELSKERAAAVEKYLNGELGSTYQLEATGKGETDPIADETTGNTGRARQRNRRVEVSYTLKQAAGYDPAGTAGPGGEATPTAATPQDGPGPVVATREHGGWRLQVHRPYVDGGLLAATYTITNVGAEENTDPPLAGEQVGAQYGALIWTNPNTKQRLMVAQIGQPGAGNVDFLQPTQSVITAIGYSRDVAETVYSYYAPPGAAKTLDLDAGPFGTISGVPVA